MYVVVFLSLLSFRAQNWAKSRRYLYRALNATGCKRLRLKEQSYIAWFFLNIYIFLYTIVNSILANKGEDLNQNN